MRYSTVLHSVKKQLGISYVEYSLADMITVLQNNPKSPTPGWCSARRKYFADFFDVSERTVQRYLKNLKEKGIIEEQNNTHYLRSTDYWYGVVNGTTDMSPLTNLTGDKSVVKPTTKMSPPYIRYILTSNNTEGDPSLSLDEFARKIERSALTKLNLELAQLQNEMKRAHKDDKERLTKAKVIIEDLIQKKTRSGMHLFSESEYYENLELFTQELEKQLPGVPVDFNHYYMRVKLWSSSKGKKSKNWIDTAMSWMMTDKGKGELKLLGAEPDAQGAIDFLNLGQ